MMVKLSLKDLVKIKEICEIAEVECFTLTMNSSSGIGHIVTLTYDSFCGDYSAKTSVELVEWENW